MIFLARNLLFFCGFFCVFFILLFIFHLKNSPFLEVFLPLILLNPDMHVSANSVDPDQLASSVCYSVCEFISKIWIKQSDWLTIRNGHGILIYQA